MTVRISWLVLLGGMVVAADWPMWRYDAARSAASPAALPTNLTLLWSRKLPPVRPAWPLAQDQRSDFDASYEPVVLGSRLFLGSPNDGSITAYDVETGVELWKFFTEGPVRCAPACWQGKVYAGSDDGYLYCLDAARGTVLWKFRGAPPERPDRRHLGNGHLVSFWPVRGGPVIMDGTVYFGAGLWAILGVFIHALDAETGRVQWSNGALHRIANVRIDHDFLRESGISPQGHCAAIRDRLIVPCGRAMPAGLERATGRLIYWTQGYYGQGASRVAAHGAYAFVGPMAVVNLHDFRELGSKWAYRGAQPPEGYEEWLAKTRNINLVPRDLLECPAIPYKLAAACDAYAAFADGVAYGSANGTFYAYDLNNAECMEREQPYGDQTIRPLMWKPPVLWQSATPYTGRKSGHVIKAGDRLYGYAGNKLLAIEADKETPRLVWEHDIEGTPSSLIAAAGRLVVATAEGTLYCFGHPAETNGAPLCHDPRPLALPEVPAGQRERIRSLVAATGIRAGYGVVLGVGDGSLLSGLLQETDLHVFGVDADAWKIAALRSRFAATGVYGVRLQLFTAEPNRFLFPPYLASLIVCGAPDAPELTETGAVARCFEILRPYGGTLAWDTSNEARRSVERWTEQAATAGARLVRKADWLLLVRDGPPAGAAPWTHDAADAANTLCSPDDLVRSPLGILWYGDECGCALDVHAGNYVTTKVNGGRVYVIQQQRPRRLFAYDAYTGRFLWEHPFTSYYSRFVALAERVYLATDGQCVVLDPATGAQREAFTFAPSGQTAAKELYVGDDVILVAFSPANEERERTIRGGANDDSWMADFFDSATLVCLDRRRGTELWRRQAEYGFKHRGFALGAGRVLCVDAMPPTVGGVVATNCESVVMALDPRSGRTLWSTRLSYTAEIQQAKYPEHWRNDWVAYAAEGNVVLGGRQNLVTALDARNGHVLWSKVNVGGVPVMIRGGMLIAQSGAAFDVLSGRSMKQFPINRIYCNYAIAGRHLIALRGESSASYTDLEAGTVHLLRSVRSGCRNSLIPAEGLLNAPNFAMICACGYPLRTSFAMVHMPEVTDWSGAAPLLMTPPPPSARDLGKER